MAVTLVSTVTVGSGGAASIEFNSIPQTGKDLLVLVSPRLNSGTDPIQLVANGSTANFTARRIYGTGSSVFSNTFAAAGQMNGNETTSSTFSNHQIYVSNYAGSSNKSISVDSVAENNATGAWQELYALLWSNSSAITSFAVQPYSGGSFVQHTTASLYIIS